MIKLFQKIKSYFSKKEVLEEIVDTRWKVCDFCKGTIEEDKGEFKVMFNSKPYHKECLRYIRKCAKKKMKGIS